MITTCTKCGALYGAGSDEQANEPERLCRTCRQPQPTLDTLPASTPPFSWIGVRFYVVTESDKGIQVRLPGGTRTTWLPKSQVRLPAPPIGGFVRSEALIRMRPWLYEHTRKILNGEINER